MNTPGISAAIPFYSPLIPSHMDEQTTMQDNPRKHPREEGLYIPRWVLFGSLIVLGFPFLMMGTMMLGMGLFGAPMMAGMSGQSHQFLWIVGVIPPLFVLGVIFLVYKATRPEKV